jgi:hypothetical protein
VPPPRGNPEAPLQLLVANLDASDYLGGSPSAASSTAASRSAIRSRS